MGNLTMTCVKNLCRVYFQRNMQDQNIFHRVSLIMKTWLLQYCQLQENTKMPTCQSDGQVISSNQGQGITVYISAYHKQKNFEALEPSPLHHQICLDLEKLKREPSEFSIHNMFSSKADLLEDIGWLYPQAHQMPKRPHHYLLVGMISFFCFQLQFV